MKTLQSSETTNYSYGTDGSHKQCWVEARHKLAKTMRSNLYKWQQQVGLRHWGVGSSGRGGPGGRGRAQALERCDGASGCWLYKCVPPVIIPLQVAGLHNLCTFLHVKYTSVKKSSKTGKENKTYDKILFL